VLQSHKSLEDLHFGRHFSDIYGSDGFLEEPGEGTAVIMKLTPKSSLLFVCSCTRESRDWSLTPRLKVLLSKFRNVLFPIFLGCKVLFHSFMLEEESLVAESARDQLRSDLNVSNVQLSTLGILLGVNRRVARPHLE